MISESEDVYGICQFGRDVPLAKMGLKWIIVDPDVVNMFADVSTFLFSHFAEML